MNFSFKKNTTGFTLIELMVVIAIIAFMALAITQIDFNRMSDNQRVDLFTNEIVSKLETIRNNALIGKWVWVNIETPDLWNIQVDDTGSGSITSSYRVWVISTNYPELSVNPSAWYDISEIKCLQLDGTSEDVVWTITLPINGNKFEGLLWCSNTNYKVLEFTAGYKSFENTISINTLSWLIEVD